MSRCSRVALLRGVAGAVGCTVPVARQRRRFLKPLAAEQSLPLGRPGVFSGWVVADMDGTLIGQPGFVEGRYCMPTLAESPCFEPLCRWLRVGGGLLVVTSDDGNGPFKRILQPLPPELRERVLVSTSDGAALFRVNANCDVSAVDSYGDGLRLDADSGYLEEVYQAAKQIYASFFQALAEDAAALESFDEAHRSAYKKVIERVRGGETTFEEALAVDNLLKPAGVRSRGTMIWRTQAGPWSNWLKQGEGSEWEQLCSRHLVAPFTSVVLLGLPWRFSEPHCAVAEPQLERLGLVVSRAPNSVWLKRPAANKAVPVRWLQERSSFAAAPPSFGFFLSDAVAFGDNPNGNDGPLTHFEDAGMPFVSVGNGTSWQGLQLGGLEAGTAAVIDQLATAVEREADVARREQRARRPLGALAVDMSKMVSELRRDTQQTVGDESIIGPAPRR